MWPFQRKAEAEPDRGPQPVPAPITRSDWKGLAPTQRAIGEHPLTARGEAFAGELATYQDPSVVSRSLGHHVSAEAPAGLVLGVARPTTREDGPAMVPRPHVQRRAATAEDIDDRDMTTMASLDGGASVTSEIPQPAAPRELPVVAAEPSVQRLTTVARDAAPMPVGAGRAVSGPLASVLEPVGHHEAIGPIGNDPVDQPLTSGPARLTLGQSRRLGLGAPLRQVPSGSVQRAAVDAAPELTLARHHQAAESMSVTTSPISPSSRPEPAEQLAPGPAEPSHEIASAPAPAASALPALGVQRAADNREPTMPVLPDLSNQSLSGSRLDLPLAPTGQSGAPAVQRAISDELATESTDVPAALTASGIEPAGPTPIPPSPTSESPAAASGPVAAISQPRHLVQRRAMAPIEALPDAALTSPVMPTTSGQPLGLQRTPARPHSSAAPMTTLPIAPGAPPAQKTPVAPLVGYRQLATTATIQRATESAPPTIHEPIGRAFDTNLSSTRVDRGDDAAQAAMSVQALAFTQGDAIALPATHGSMQSGRGRLELQARAVEQQAAQDMPLAPVASVASVQRATAIAESAAAVASAPSFSIQRDLESAPAPASSSSGGPANAPAPGAATGTASSSSPTHADHEQDMDELAGKLYDRIRGRLKSELLVDRERAGLLTDLR